MIENKLRVDGRKGLGDGTKEGTGRAEHWVSDVREASLILLLKTLLCCMLTN